METYDSINIQDEVQSQHEEQQEQQQPIVQSENIANAIPDIATPFQIEMCDSWTKLRRGSLSVEPHSTRPGR